MDRWGSLRCVSHSKISQGHSTVLGVFRSSWATVASLASVHVSLLPCKFGLFRCMSGVLRQQTSSAYPYLPPWHDLHIIPTLHHFICAREPCANCRWGGTRLLVWVPGSLWSLPRHTRGHSFICTTPPRPASLHSASANANLRRFSNRVWVQTVGRVALQIPLWRVPALHTVKGASGHRQNGKKRMKCSKRVASFVLVPVVGGSCRVMQ